MLAELLVVIAIIVLLLLAVQRAREAARRIDCLSDLRQICLAVLQYYESNSGDFFLHHPIDADVTANSGPADSFAEIYWADKIIPFIDSEAESEEPVTNRCQFLCFSFYWWRFTPVLIADIVNPVQLRLKPPRSGSQFSRDFAVECERDFGQFSCFSVRSR